MAGRAAHVLARCGLLGALEYAESGTDRVRVIAFHRIDEPGAEPDLDPGLLSATPEVFRSQMEVIAEHYSAISLDTFMAAVRGEGDLPRRAVLLTFDDGYEDFERVAWPILQHYGLPAVLFVSTDFPDNPGPGFWWDRLHAALSRSREPRIAVDGLGLFELPDAKSRRDAHRAIRGQAKRLPHAEAMVWLDKIIGQLADLPSLHRVLGWDALRKLSREGLSVCSHGNTHALCARLRPDELRQDLQVSKARIEKELGELTSPPVIAYPASSCNSRVFAAVKEAGYELAFGGQRGIDRLPLKERFNVMRMPVLGYGTSLFRAQLRPSVSRLGRVLIDRRSKKSA